MGGATSKPVATAGAGAVTGAGAGFLIGGPVGAVIGGVGGAATGGLIGVAEKSRKVEAPDNSALVQAQEKQQEILDKKAAEINKQKQQKLQNTADSANARRRSQMSMSSLIKTSENGLLGSISKLGK
jgi:hypothetical protein